MGTDTRDQEEPQKRPGCRHSGGEDDCSVTCMVVHGEMFVEMGVAGAADLDRMLRETGGGRFRVSRDR